MVDAFWKCSAVANYGLNSSIIHLRFETIPDQSANCQPTYRLWMSFNADPSALFAATFDTLSNTYVAQYGVLFPTTLRTLFESVEKHVDVVAIGESQMSLIVRANTDGKDTLIPSIGSFMCIMQLAPPNDIQRHLLHLIEQAKREAEAERLGKISLRNENQLIRHKLVQHEKTQEKLKENFNTLVRMMEHVTICCRPSPEQSVNPQQKVDDHQEEFSNSGVQQSSSNINSASDDISVPSKTESPTSNSTSKDILLGVVSYLLCSLCDNITLPATDDMEMRRHFIDAHVDDQKRQCRACPDLTSFDVRSHMKVHMNRIYACGYCGKRGRKHFLKSHVRTHTGEKPFVCDCGRQFSDQSTYRRHHSTIHGVPKKFSCPECGQKMARKDNFKVHLRNHQSGKGNVSLNSSEPTGEDTLPATVT